MSTFIIPFIGGLLIGLAAILLMIANGRIAGISGIFSHALFAKSDNKGLSWQMVFIIGLLIGGGLYRIIVQPDLSVQVSVMPLIIAGLLVGFGSVLGSGCTSGHGICGIGRLSKRSIVATCVFMLSGIVTATLVH
ncbi:YeeE/YedE family protein [Shewanella waksmanii]|uniref:YeeE/YedE family protein n=1 Tax=Shewanella waksmanii TaxID=213783 RepID=UPI003735E7EF